MRLNAYCKSCKSKNFIKSKRVLTRQDLQILIGDETKFNCKKCGYANKIHINRVFATSSKLAVILFAIIGLLVAFAGPMFMRRDLVGVMLSLGIGGTIFTAVLISNLSSTASAFNKSFI